MSLKRRSRAALRHLVGYAAGDPLARHAVHFHVVPQLYRVRFALKPLTQPDRRRVFVDMGANVGGGFAFFRKLCPPESWAYRFFEPNPHCVEALRAEIAGTDFVHGAAIEEKAVWIRDEELAFFGIAETADALTQGGSVVADHNSGQYRADAGAALRVQAIDVAPYIAALQRDYDDVVVKMDIEGAELDVLEHLWRSPEVRTRPLRIFAEFHSIYMAGDVAAGAAARERAIVASAPSNVILHRWF